jgi:hypothetical protein
LKYLVGLVLDRDILAFDVALFFQASLNLAISPLHCLPEALQMQAAIVRPLALLATARAY